MLSDECKTLVTSDEERKLASQPLTSAIVHTRNAQVLALLGLLLGSVLAMTWFVHGRPAPPNFVRRTTSPYFPPNVEDVEKTPAVGKAPASNRRKGSFIVIGDWGYDEYKWAHGNINASCQKAIADKMLSTFRTLGDVQFIINVGDSFYPNGVASKEDVQWDIKWRNVYPPELRSVPWYSVYGNHDYHKDPCVCTDNAAECAQVNTNVSDLDYFYMPGYNWHRVHPDLDLEVIGLDMNHYMWAWFKNAPNESQCMWDCKYTACPEDCSARLERRAMEAELLFRQRYAESPAKNLLVISHYPTDYFWSRPEFLDALSDDSRHHVEFFGGHRHNTDQESTISIAPNNNWLVGGGGGWSCDAPEVGVPIQQGFVVGEIFANSDVATHGVYVDNAICCPSDLKPYIKDDEEPKPNKYWPPRCKS
jgi:hypothetical protein